jgi:protein tyrosine phosphatase (PTP) superfamily phosphohydrolase (DUF442 family)
MLGVGRGGTAGEEAVMRRAIRTAVVLGLAISLAGASGTPGEAPVRIEAGGIENLYRVTPRLYSGGQPEGDAAFRALAGLGVKTIVTVDGAAPDVEAARKHGLRYVHVPVGYDGIDGASASAIVRAAATLPGPVYLHCHHGKHRGPTAASLCLIALEGWSADRAAAWMKEAGTSPDYAGLYQTIASFRVPDLDALRRDPAPLPERVEPPGLVEVMIEVDHASDRLKALPKAADALLLAEQYREAARLEESRERGPAFLGALAVAERNAEALRAALSAPEGGAAGSGRVASAFKSVVADCKGCHAAHRDVSSR